MSLPQLLIKKLSLFFMLSTLITVAVSLIGSHFDSEAGLSYHALLSPLFYAACCVLPSFVTYSGRELKPREWVLRVALQFVLTEAVILFLAFRSSVIDTSRPAVVLAIAGSVLVIFLLSFCLSWLTNAAQAKQVNAELLDFQRRRQSGEF